MSSNLNGMSRFKPGQLVMLVVDGLSMLKAPAGTIGEVLEWKDEYKLCLPPEQPIIALFPNFLSESKSKAWGMQPDWIIPINDPDADVTEHTEKPIEDLV